VARRAFPPPATMTVRRTVGPAVALPSVAVIVGQVSGADLKTLAGDTGWPMFVVHPVSEMSVKAHLKCSQPSRTICCGRLSRLGCSAGSHNRRLWYNRCGGWLAE